MRKKSNFSLFGSFCIFTITAINQVMYFLFPICACLLFIMSCSKTEYKMERHISEIVKIDPSQEDVPLQENNYVIDSIRALHLPENVEYVSVDKFIVQNNRIYIMDSEVNKTVFVFDNNGNYLYKLGERGRAKHEYIYGPTDFFVDKMENVHVFDKTGQKVLAFDKRGKIFRAVNTHAFFPVSFGITSNNRYAYCMEGGEEEEPSMLMCDWDFSDTKAVLPNAGHFVLVPNPNTFFLNDDLLSYIPLLSDSVLVYRDDTLEKVVRFDFGRKFLRNEIPEAAYDIRTNIKGYKGVLALYSYQETDNLILLEYLYKDTVCRWLFNKNTKQSFSSYNLFEGANPATMYYLRGKQMIGLVRQDVMEDYRKVALKKDKYYLKHLERTPQPIRDVMDEKVKAPLVIYFSIK